MSSVLFSACNLSLLVAAWLLVDLGYSTASTTRRAAATALVFTLLSLGLALLLGFARILTPIGQVISCTILASCTALVWRQKRNHYARVANGLDVETASVRRREALLSASLVAALIIPHTALLEMPRRAYDDYTYHAPATFEFMLNGSLELAQPLLLQKWFPMNAELLAAWFFLPSGSDAYWSLVGLWWVVLGTLLLFDLSQSASRHWWSGAAVAGAFAACHAVTEEMKTHTATDLAVAVALLGMLAALRPAKKEPLSRFSLAIAGAAAGAMVGTKISYASALLPVAVYLFLLLRRTDKRRRYLDTLTFCVPLFLIGSFWYLRNWLVTGNPVYPAQAGPFWGPFDPASQDYTKLGHWLFGDRASFENWRKAASQYFKSGGILVPFALIGLIAKTFLVARELARSGARLSAGQAFQLLLLACAWTLCLTSFFMPFSGTANQSRAELFVRARFTIGALSLGLLFFGERGRAWAVILVAASIFSNFYEVGIEHASVGIVAALALLGGGFLLRSRIAPRYALAFALCLGIVTLALAEPWLQRQVDKNSFKRKLSGIPLGKAWLVLDGLPAGQRIASIGFGYWQPLGLYGRRLQHRAVGVFDDGTAYPHDLHRVWNELRRHRLWWDPWFPEARRFRVENVQAERINYLVLQRKPKRPWPKARAVLRRSRSATRVARASQFEIWHIGPAGSS